MRTGHEKSTDCTRGKENDFAQNENARGSYPELNQSIFCRKSRANGTRKIDRFHLGKENGLQISQNCAGCQPVFALTTDEILVAYFFVFEANPPYKPLFSLKRGRASGG